MHADVAYNQGEFKSFLGFFVGLCRALGIKIIVVDRNVMDLKDNTVTGVLLQYPDTKGNVYDLQHITEAAHKNGVSCF